MGIEKTRQLVRDSVNWINRNMDIEDTIKLLDIPLIPAGTTKRQCHSSQIPGKLMEAVGTDLFTINKSNFLCVLDYYSKFPLVK